jgi:hypothetical protein
MIDSESIRVYARMRGVDPFLIENDYLQHVALTCIYEEFSNELVFKGGTALQKAYGLERLSRDLDFNLEEGEPSAKIERIARRMCDYYQTSITGPKRIKHGLGYKMHIEGPSFGATGIRHILPITFNTEEKLLLKPDFKSINPGTIYRDPDLHAYSLLIMNIEEIMAEKVRALATRKEVKPRDLYDLWFLLSNGFELDIGLARKKIEYDHAVFSIDKLKERVKEIEPLWDSDLKPLARNLPGYDVAASMLLNELKP